MFVGHAALAFAVVSWLSRHHPRAKAPLSLGLVAAAFATLPDIDILYAPVGLLGSRLDALALASAFWSASTLVHRGVTHSLVIASLVALLAVAWFVGTRRARLDPLRVAALICGTALVAGVALDAGHLAGTVTLFFVGGALVVSTVVARRSDIDIRWFAIAATVGLLSHPFGDVFTGAPPAFFYPFDVVWLTERVTLAADPTIHLLAAFALELATIWLAVFAFLRWSASDESVSFRRAVSPRVVVAGAYAAALFVVPAPTLDYSYPFVFSVVAVGLVGAVPRVTLRGRRRMVVLERTTAFVTALASVTVALVAYTVGYLLL